MLSKQENELVTRTGPGTPMGEVLRRYWIPVALSRELPEPDCPPVPVTVLGEQLVAFRDTHRRVGLLERFCAHRGTSLCLGRNEEMGLRCTYHGWKYDVEGNCVDTPTEPPESDLKHKVRLKAYPTLELANAVWAYMGPGEQQPEPPDLEWAHLPPDHSYVSKVWQECNWLQALEGGLDEIHVSFLHALLDRSSARAGVPLPAGVATGYKERVFPTAYGFCFGGSRPRDGQTVVHIRHYLLPFHTNFAYMPRHYGQARDHEGLSRPLIGGHMFVPINDENCMVYNLIYSFDGNPLSEQEIKWTEWHRGRGPGELTSDFKRIRNLSNDYIIDWHVMKTETYSGIEGINTQDASVQESMGAIVDRTQEHLGVSDVSVVELRQVLLEAIKTVQNRMQPPGLQPTERWARPMQPFLSNGVNWWDAFQDEIFVQKTGTPAAAK